MAEPVSVTFAPSTRKVKKMMAHFQLDDGRSRTVHFGASGYSDFTKHRDPQRRDRYIARHRANEDWSSPMTAGALSRYILWNKPTLRASIADYRKRFALL